MKWVSFCRFTFSLTFLGNVAPTDLFENAQFFKKRQKCFIMKVATVQERYPRAIKNKGGSGPERSYEIKVVHFQTNATASRHKH